ncbi:MAG: hypothetical protein ACKOPE_00530 [Novosphingobium sp.]
MKTALLLAATCALAACSGGKEPDASSTTGPALTEAAAPVQEASEAAASIVTIPDAMQGRWGLVPADCTTTRGDDKGLVTIGPKAMKFYESIATAKTIAQDADGTVKATFAYSGEGMEWTRQTTFAVKDGGKTLVFEEFGDEAPRGARTYTRCPG